VTATRSTPSLAPSIRTTNSSHGSPRVDGSRKGSPAQGHRDARDVFRSVSNPVASRFGSVVHKGADNLDPRLHMSSRPAARQVRRQFSAATYEQIRGPESPVRRDGRRPQKL